MFFIAILLKLKYFAKVMFYYYCIMTVYIENVIADNFVVTYMISALSYRICGIRVKKTRCIIAATVGTIVAVLYPFVKNVWFTLLIKISLYIILCSILYFGKKRKYLPLVFMGLTLFFGGVMLAICFCMGNLTGILLDGVYDFSPGIIIAIAWILLKIIKKIRDKFVKKRDAENGIGELLIEINGKQKKVNAFMDTGNRVYDVKSGLPVIIIKLTSLAELFEESELLALFMGDSGNSKYYAGTTKIKGIGGKQVKVVLIHSDNIILTLNDVKKTFYDDVLLGVVNFTIDDSIEYDAVLHPAMILGGIK